MTRILIVDDHEIARRGLEQALAGRVPDATFGEATTTEEALQALGAARWDLALVDLNLPGRGGLELLEEVRRLWPQVRVLVVSASAEEEFALRCLRLGAGGYVTKTSGSAEIVADAWPDRSFSGRVATVATEAEFTPRNIQTRTDRDRLVYRVEVRMENADGALPPGMPV